MRFVQRSVIYVSIPGLSCSWDLGRICGSYTWRQRVDLVVEWYWSGDLERCLACCPIRWSWLHPHLFPPMEGHFDSSKSTTPSGRAPSGDLPAPSEQRSLRQQGLQPSLQDPSSPSRLPPVYCIDQQIAHSLSVRRSSDLQPPSHPTCGQKVTDSLRTMVLSYDFDCRSLAFTPARRIVTTDNATVCKPQVPPSFIHPLVIAIDCSPPASVQDASAIQEVLVDLPALEPIDDLSALEPPCSCRALPGLGALPADPPRQTGS